MAYGVAVGAPDAMVAYGGKEREATTLTVHLLREHQSLLRR